MISYSFLAMLDICDTLLISLMNLQNGSKSSRAHSKDSDMYTHTYICSSSVVMECYICSSLVIVN
jgi:hypothetical protein